MYERLDMRMAYPSRGSRGKIQGKKRIAIVRISREDGGKGLGS